MDYFADTAILSQSIMVQFGGHSVPVCELNVKMGHGDHYAVFYFCLWATMIADI